MASAPADMEADDQDRRVLVDRCQDLLDDATLDYHKHLSSMIKKSETRLPVTLFHLRRAKGLEANKTLADDLLERPMMVLPALEEAALVSLKRILGNLAPAPPRLHVSIVGGGFGRQQVSPNQLGSAHITHLVQLEGIVSRMSAVRPRLCRLSQYCEKTNQFVDFTFRDATSFDGPPTGSAYPKADEDENPYTPEIGLSHYENTQKVWVQDMPERTKAGEMPRAVCALLNGDLVDAAKPGDRVRIVGVFRSLAGNVSGVTSATLSTVVIANSVQILGGQRGVDRPLVEADIQTIRKLARQKETFSLFADSLAPNIYGHREIKKALVLQLLGGVEKNLDNGTHIRGDINMLLIGDPSTAKSQLLRAMYNLSPLAINTTGRGSSGVGLTAAVLMDRDSGERRLEAGAMVLADRGLVCIDEFDKMTDEDRTAIHEVMEQQTVTIAKAGLHTSLNARCSVLAAANPIYGEYNRQETPQKNIRLPDSLLSRFDLLFVVLDDFDDPEKDGAIAEHVLRQHRYRHRGGDAVDEFGEESTEAANAAKESQVYERYDKNIHGAAEVLRARRNERRHGFFTSEFMRKYIEYAKTNFSPVLSDESIDVIANKYADLRSQEEARSLPITARALETIIRLSSAHAKLRLKNRVDPEDVQEAIEIVDYALTNNITFDDDEDSSSDEEDDADRQLNADGGQRDDRAADPSFRGPRVPRAAAKTPPRRTGRHARAAVDADGDVDMPDADESDAGGPDDGPAPAAARVPLGAVATAVRRQLAAKQAAAAATPTRGAGRTKRPRTTTPTKMGASPSAATGTPRRKRARTAAPAGDAAAAASPAAAAAAAAPAADSGAELSAERLAQLTKLVGTAMRRSRELQFQIPVLLGLVNAVARTQRVPTTTVAELRKALAKMDAQNKVMISGDVVVAV